MVGYHTAAYCELDRPCRSDTYLVFRSRLHAARRDQYCLSTSYRWTDAGDLRFLASTSYTEQTPGGASPSRDLVSMPHPPAGGPVTRVLGFGELELESRR